MSDIPLCEALPKWITKQVPGPILAPCRPRLTGDSEDFADWDEPDTLWIEDTSHWFYVFGQHCVENEDGKLVKAVRLHYEIFVDASGEMHVVDSDKHWGHDRRPASDKLARNVFVEVGYARIDCVVEPYPIWVLASPFQLSWAHLPPMVAKTRTCRWSAFEIAADQLPACNQTFRAPQRPSTIRSPTRLCSFLPLLPLSHRWANARADGSVPSPASEPRCRLRVLPSRLRALDGTRLTSCSHESARRWKDNLIRTDARADAGTPRDTVAHRLPPPDPTKNPAA